MKRIAESKHRQMVLTEGKLECMYVVCKEHVELAIDKFVDEYEDAPDVVNLEDTEFANWDPPAKCQECDHPAKFLIV